MLNIMVKIKEFNFFSKRDSLNIEIIDIRKNSSKQLQFKDYQPRLFVPFKIKRLLPRCLPRRTNKFKDFLKISNYRK